MIAWKLIKSFTSFLKPKYNESELSVTFSNGSVIELKGAENEDSLRGTGLWGLVIDEFASIYNNWAVWNEVLRPALTDKKGWTLFIGTPKGKDALFELYIRGQHKDAGYLSFKYKTIDNPYIDPEEVEMAKQQMSERYFRQEYEASFEDFVGLVYPEFSSKAIIEPFYVQTHYSRIGAIDPAISGTTGVLKAFVDEKGCLIIYEEYYEQNVRVSEVAKIIRENSVRWFIDPSSAEKNIVKEGKLYSLYNEYSENDIRPIPAENDVEAGINRVAEYFKNEKIKIFSSCKNLIYELERYHWSSERETRTGLTKPKPYKKDDHLCVVGDTKILMANLTEKAIKDIKIGEWVKTSNGNQVVIDSRKTGNVEVSMLKLATGQLLIGTGGHKVYTNQGKKRLDCLRYGDMISVWKLSILIEGNIIGMANTMLKAVERAVCILTFGFSTMAKFLKDTVFTIKTKIQQITIFPILKLDSQGNICPTIQKGNYKTQSIEERTKYILAKSAHSLKSGTLLKWEKNGTVSIAKKSGQIINILKKNVSVVPKFIKHLSQLVQSIAQIIANQPTVESISTTKTRQDVYNLTVANSHNYYANGILVANCDSLRYLVMSRMSKTEFDDRPLNPNSAWGQLQAALKEKEADGW